MAARKTTTVQKPKNYAKYDTPPVSWRKFWFFNGSTFGVDTQDYMRSLRSRLDATILSVTGQYHSGFGAEYSDQRYGNKKSAKTPCLWYQWYFWFCDRHDPKCVNDFQQGLKELVDTQALAWHKANNSLPSVRWINLWGNIIVYYESNLPQCAHVANLIRSLQAAGYQTAIVTKEDCNV
jgi:hypothetical protein